jgi:hypothetical protein
MNANRWNIVDGDVKVESGGLEIGKEGSKLTSPYSTKHGKLTQLHDFRLLLWCEHYLHSSRMLHSIDW